MNLQIESRKENETCTVYVKGEIDAFTAPQLKDKLDSIVVEGTKLVINMEEVSYIDSTGLGVFVGVLKLTRTNGGSLQLIEVNDRVNRLLKITGLSEIMNVAGREN
jgi:anti-sigma B factor antagonist